MTFGLNNDTIERINSIFTQYKNIEKVIIYGSRAKGTNRPNSDIDLTIISQNLSFTELMKIENQIDDLLLPHKADLSLFRQIANSDLIDHINRVGKTFFSK